MKHQRLRNGMQGEELVSYARKRAKECCKKDRESIRLFADLDYCYYLFNFGGVIYIGSYTKSKYDDEMPPFYSDRSVYYSSDNVIKVQVL